MDNCMFQIETALLDFHDQEIGSAMTDKTSIIKRSAALIPFRGYPRY